MRSTPHPEPRPQEDAIHQDANHQVGILRGGAFEAGGGCAPSQKYTPFHNQNEG